MKFLRSILLLIFGLFALKNYAQQISSPVIVKENKYNPLAPSKAAFYSAILPGAGQVYNKRCWWQLPLIYGGMGLSMYYYTENHNGYIRYRTAYKRRRAGLPDIYDGKGDKPFISISGLESAQRQTRKNREMSLISFIGVYVLQIVEASVTAHLLQFDDDDSLSISPISIPDNSQKLSSTLGLSFKYTF